MTLVDYSGRVEKLTHEQLLLTELALRRNLAYAREDRDLKWEAETRARLLKVRREVDRRGSQMRLWP